MLDRFATDWKRQDPASGRPFPWSATVLAGLGGAAWALALLLALGSRLRFTYRPYDGVVGLPAILNYPSQQEIFFYLAGLGLATLLGWLFAQVARRLGWPTLWTGLLALAGLALMITAARLCPSPAGDLLKKLLAQPPALLQTALSVLAIALLGQPQWRREKPAPTAPQRGLGQAQESLSEAASAWLARFVPILFHLLVVLIAFLPTLPMALMLAPPAALALAWVQAPLTGKPRKGTHLLVWLEALAWAILALIPLAAWGLRLARTLAWPLPSPPARMLLVLVAVLLPIATGWLRRRLHLRPWVKPTGLLPWSAGAAMALAASVAQNYDAFHQGEFIYPAEALRRGLLPWRDIFYVHGFGANTLLGWLMGRPTPATWGLDLAIYCLLAGICVGLAAWFCLRLWSERWWLAALIVALLAAPAAAAVSGRYLVMWCALLATLQYLRTERLRWLTASGVLAWGGLFFSLDTGALTLTAIGAWSLAWGLGGLNRDTAHPRPQARLWPALAFGLGVLAAALPTLAALGAFHLLDDFWQIHLEYVRVKRHYDKIPLALNNFAILVAPALSVLGLWASATILRRRERTPLTGAILLLTLLSILAYTRSLDRADFGHVIYATIPAWALAGCLVVWRASGPLGSRRPLSLSLARAALFSLLLGLIPYAHPLLRSQPNGQPLLLTIPAYLHYYPLDVQKPFCGPVSDEASRNFFALCEQLRKRPGAGATLYDFSNQPALYVWTGINCPTRFFAAYYASSLRWQEDVIGSLERQRVRWVLWRGPNPFFNAPDQIPNYVRQWHIAEYILRHFRPARRLAGESLLLARTEDQPTTQRGNPQGSINLALSGLEDLPYLRGPFKPEAPNWSARLGPSGTAWEAGGLILHNGIDFSPVNLGELPYLWGKFKQEAPPRPATQWRSVKATIPRGGRATVPVPPGDKPLSEAAEVEVSFEQKVKGEFKLEWGEAGSQPSATSVVSFKVRPKFRGPYRVRLANLPAWVWLTGPNRLTLSLSPAPDKDVRVRLVFMGENAGR